MRLKKEPTRKQKNKKGKPFWHSTVAEKKYITEADAVKLQKDFGEKTLHVRGFLGSKFDYFDAHQERVLTVAEA